MCLCAVIVYEARFRLLFVQLLHLQNSFHSYRITVMGQSIIDLAATRTKRLKGCDHAACWTKINTTYWVLR